MPLIARSDARFSIDSLADLTGGDRICEISVPTEAQSGKLRDRDIRAALLQALTKYYGDSEVQIVNELCVAMGYSKLDVAVLNGHLHGYEIKSDCDSLTRLPRQLREYEQICDTLTIVTTPRFCKRIEASVPDWCGIVVASTMSGCLRLEVHREARNSPAWDVLALMVLLWQSETVAFARSYGFRAPKDMAKGLIHAQLARRIAHDQLREGVLGILRSRIEKKAKLIAYPSQYASKDVPSSETDCDAGSSLTRRD